MRRKASPSGGFCTSKAELGAQPMLSRDSWYGVRVAPALCGYTPLWGSDPVQCLPSTPGQCCSNKRLSLLFMVSNLFPSGRRSDPMPATGASLLPCLTLRPIPFPWPRTGGGTAPRDSAFECASKTPVSFRQLTIADISFDGELTAGVEVAGQGAGMLRSLVT